MSANNVHRIGESSGGVEGWFQALPFVTRYWLSTALLATCAGNFGIIAPVKLIFNWNQVWGDFEIWRFLTPFLYVGQFSFPTVIALHMLYTFSQRYEMEPYNTGAGGGTADYLFALMFGAVATFVTYPFMRVVLPLPPVFARTLTFFVLYTWSKRHPTAQAGIMGFELKAIHMPFAYVLLTVMMGQPFGDMVHGIVLGHLFYFLVDVVPIVYGKDVLHTPQFLIDRFGAGAYVAPAPPAGGAGGGAVGNNVWRPPGRANPPQDPAASSRGYNWGGGGRTLGSS